MVMATAEKVGCAQPSPGINCPFVGPVRHPARPGLAPTVHAAHWPCSDSTCVTTTGCYQSHPHRTYRGLPPLATKVRLCTTVVLCMCWRLTLGAACTWLTNNPTGPSGGGGGGTIGDGGGAIGGGGGDSSGGGGSSVAGEDGGGGTAAPSTSSSSTITDTAVATAVVVPVAILGMAALCYVKRAAVKGKVKVCACL